VGISGLFNERNYALLWSGSAASVVNLNPPGYLSSIATRIVGDWVIGEGYDSSNQHHALLWDLSTSPSTVTDFQAASDAAGVSRATPWNISSSGDIVGVNVTVTNPGPPPERFYTPVLWTPATPRLPGDANLDGKVSFADFQILERNYGSNDSYWKMADFNDDRVTDDADFVLLLRHYGQTVDGSAVAVSPGEREALAAFAASVPEPGAVAFVVLSFVALGRRKRALKAAVTQIDIRHAR
jgi:hypothetical protein